jgi:hypothetical protein
MSRVLAGAALVLFFLLVLVARTPAHMMGYFMPAESVRLSGFSGTIWEGVAASSAVSTDAGWIQLGRLQWSLSRLYLLLLSPTADLESRWGQQDLRARVRLYPTGSYRVQGLEASFSAGLIKQWLPVSLRGDINVMMDELRVSDGQARSGSGRVVWQRASWRGNRGFQPLGDYVLQFEVAGPQQFQGRVSTLQGPVEVEGGLDVNGRSYSVDARLSSEQGFDPELASALQLMAAPVQGGYQLKFDSEF